MAVLLVRDGERVRFNLPIRLLPEGVQEGDVLDITMTIDQKATDDAKARVSSRIERLKRKSQEGSGIIQDPEE